MTPFLGGDDETDDEPDTKRCNICQQLKQADELDDDGLCNSCRSTATQKCPRCRSTSITHETKDNPQGWETHASGTITIWECQNCGYRSGFRHDWRWE